MTTRSRWKFRMCTTTNVLTLYSFSSLYIFVTWGWPTVAETSRQPNKTDTKTVVFCTYPLLIWISLRLRKESRNWLNGLPTESALDSYYTVGQNIACLCPIAGHRAHTSQTLDSALRYFRSVPFEYWQPVALRYIWTARAHYAQCARWHLPVQLCTRNFIRRRTACFLYTCRIYSMSPVAWLTNVTVLCNKFSLWYSPLYYIIFSRSVNPLFPNLYIYIYIYIYT